MLQPLRHPHLTLWHPRELSACRMWRVRRYRAIYPVFTDRIHVNGRQWVEPMTTTSCRLHACIQVKVDIAIIGGTTERWIEQMVRQAYVDLPIRAREYALLSGKISGHEPEGVADPVARIMAPPATAEPPPPPPPPRRTDLASEASAVAEKGVDEAPGVPPSRNPLIKCLPAVEQCAFPSKEFAVADSVSDPQHQRERQCTPEVSRPPALRSKSR